MLNMIITDDNVCEIKNGPKEMIFGLEYNITGKVFNFDDGTVIAVENAGFRVLKKGSAFITSDLQSIFLGMTIKTFVFGDFYAVDEV